MALTPGWGVPFLPERAVGRFVDSRSESLQAPPGARQAPLVVFLGLIGIAAITVIVGLSGWGWLVALLIPMVAMTFYIVLNTVWVLRQERRNKVEGKEEE